MRGFHRAAIVAVLFAITGCMGQRKREIIDVAPVLPESKYATTDLGDLVEFAGKVAEASSADRLKECQELLQLSHDDHSLGVRLHLLLAQSIAESCGNSGEATALIDPALAEIGNSRLKSLLVYQKAILTRFDRELNRRKVLERRISQVISKEQKAHRRLQSQEGELRVLQRKLDALKEIEQSLDEAKDEP